MRPPLRIAVLETDTPLENTNKKYGGYGGVFEALLKTSAAALGGQPDKLDPERDLQISKWDVVNGDKYPELEDIDAILITGSSAFFYPPLTKGHRLTDSSFLLFSAEHNSFEDIPWINRLVEFTQKVHAHDRVRIIGVCFGHQIVGRALGVKVGRNDEGWETSVCDVELTEKGKELFQKDKLVSEFPFLWPVTVWWLDRIFMSNSISSFFPAEPAPDAP